MNDFSFNAILDYPYLSQFFPAHIKELETVSTHFIYEVWYINFHFLKLNLLINVDNLQMKIQSQTTSNQHLLANFLKNLKIFCHDMLFEKQMKESIFRSV